MKIWKAPIIQHELQWMQFLILLYCVVYQKTGWSLKAFDVFKAL